MLLLANLIFGIGFICAASQDGPFKYDISREINVQESNYMDEVKEELLSKFIQNTLEFSNNDDPKLNLIESNSIIDEALVEPFTDKYDKEFSNPVDQSTRMKRARKLSASTDSIPTTEESEEDESVHGFVRQLIPSLLPIPKDAESLESNSSKPKFEDEFEDIFNVSSSDGREDNTNLPINGGDENRNGNDTTNSADAKEEDDIKIEDDENNENNSTHESGTPMCPLVSPNLNDQPITTTPTPGNVEVSTIRVDVRPHNKPDETKPTSSQPNYPPPNLRDGEVICTDRTLGKNCSEYIISLYGDEMALYLKITSSLKADLIKASKAFIPKYTMNQLPFYVRRNVDTTAAYVPKSTKMVTPVYKPSPKYFTAAKNYVKPTSTPAIRSVSIPMKRVPLNSQRRMLPTLPHYTTPKYMKERRIQVYPTQRTISELSRSISRKPPQQSMPMRNMTPRFVSVQKKNLPTRPATPNIPELTNQLRHKLKLLRNLTASKMGENGKLPNRVKPNKPDPRLVSKHGNKILASNNRKQKAHVSAAKRPVARKSDLQNMIVPPKQKYPEKYRPNSYQLRGKYSNLPRPKPKPDHLPGVISGLTKREGVTFFNYYPFKESASGKRMKRSAAGSKSKKPYNFFMFSS